MRFAASLNHAYRLVWDLARNMWIPVAETSRGRGKSGRVVLLGAGLLSLAGGGAWALPTGGQIGAGTGQIAQSGNQMSITQGSQNLVINWQGFSIGGNEGVTFNQPGSGAIALNRVLGQDPSQILGSLRANGQVFVLNPNGVLFGSSAQVSVGGLVASTLGLSDSDFLAGKYSFSGDSTAAVSNAGRISAANGGYVALLGASVSNSGELVATAGNVSLAAGQQVTLQLANGSLLGLTVDRGAVAAVASNHGVIQADGGQVLLTAQAADRLTGAVVNNDGLIEAQTLDQHNGTILLLGDMNSGTVNVGGTLDASAPHGGDGGLIETSAAQVNIGSASITAAASSGKSGTWLIDPTDLTIDSTAAATISSTLDGGTSVAEETTAGGASGVGTQSSGNGDINVNAALSWSGFANLSLSALHDININAAITAPTGSLALSSGGDITQTAPISASMIFGGAGGSVLLTNAGNAIGNLGGFSVADTFSLNNSGALFTAGMISAGSLSLTANGGIYESDGVLTVTGTSSFNAGGNAIMLTSTQNSFGGAVSLSNSGANDVTLNSSNALLLGAVNVGSGTLTVNGGGISQIGSITAAGTANFNAGSGALALGNGGNSFTGAVSASGNGIAITSNGNLNVAALVNATDSAVNLRAGGTLTLPAAAIATGTANLTLASVDGALSTAGSLSGADVALSAGQALTLAHDVAATGTLSLISSGGAITQTGGVLSANTLSGHSSGSTQLTDLNAITTLGGFVASGLTLVNGQTLTVNGPVNGGASLSLTTISGDLAIIGGMHATSVSLNSAGALSQGGGGIDATTLSGSSVGITALGSANNSIASLGSFSANSGATTGPGLLLNSWDLSVGGAITAGGDVTLSALRNLTLAPGASIGGANIVLAAGDTFTNNAGAGVLSVGSGGHWQLWSQNPANDTLGGLVYDFKQYNATFGVTTVQGSGDGVFYTLAPTLVVSLTGTTGKTYDAATAATLGSGNYSVAGALAGDTLTLNNPTAGSYDTANAGTGKTVTVNGLAISSGTDSSGAAVYGYQLNTTASAAIGTVNQAALTLSAGTLSKVYDGSTAATAATVAVSGLQGSDTVTGLSESFASKNVLGTNGSTLNVNAGYTVNDGNNGGNYSVSSNTALGTITPKAIDATGIAANSKVYDATASATLNTAGAALSGVIGGDAVTLDASAGSAAFGDKNVGSGKAVAVSGLALSGSDGGNYTLNAYGTTASITPKALFATAILANDKIYDAGTGATLDTSAAALSGNIGGDAVSINAAAAAGAFASRHVGSGKAVVVTGLALSGGDSGNYTLNSYGTTASIAPAALTLSSVSDSKTYNGNTISSGTVNVSGLLGSDSVSSLTQSFASKNVLGANGSTLNVNAGYVVNDGNGGGNYTVATNSATGTITQTGLTVTATNAGKMQGAANPVLGASYSGFVSGEGAADLGGSLTLMTDASTTSAAGSYSITPTGLTSGNYAISYVNGTLTVIPATPLPPAPPVNPVVNAITSVISVVVSNNGAPIFVTPNLGSSSSGASASSSDSKSDIADSKKDDKKDEKSSDSLLLTSKDSGVKNDVPIKKMYCN